MLLYNFLCDTYKSKLKTRMIQWNISAEVVTYVMFLFTFCVVFLHYKS